jgi:hypothetical protein
MEQEFRTTKSLGPFSEDEYLTDIDGGIQP